MPPPEPTDTFLLTTRWTRRFFGGLTVLGAGVGTAVAWLAYTGWLRLMRRLIILLMGAS